MQAQSTDLWQFPPGMRLIIEEELDPGEKIKWAGSPHPGRFALRSIPFVIFGIPWTLFAVFWTLSAADFHMPDFSSAFDLIPLFGIPFILIGVLLLSTPVLMWKKARETAYVLTDSRAFIVEGVSSPGVRSFGKHQLLDLRRIERKNGRGDLKFISVLNQEKPETLLSTKNGFLAIEDVRDVEKEVRKMLKATQPKAGGFG